MCKWDAGAAGAAGGGSGQAVPLVMLGLAMLRRSSHMCLAACMLCSTTRPLLLVACWTALLPASLALVTAAAEARLARMHVPPCSTQFL